MRMITATLSAMLMLAAIALPASAEVQLSLGANSRTHPANATMIAKHIKCGGPDLQCGPDLAQVCNLRNNKCCCLTVGTYH